MIGLVAAEDLEEPPGSVDGVDGLPPESSPARLPLERDPEHAPTLVLGADGEVGWFWNDRRVCPVPPQAAGKRAVRPAELLVHHRLDQEVSREPDVKLVQRPQGRHRSGHAALHIKDSQTVLLALSEGA